MNLYKKNKGLKSNVIKYKDQNENTIKIWEPKIIFVIEKEKINNNT